MPHPVAPRPTVPAYPVACLLSLACALGSWLYLPAAYAAVAPEGYRVTATAAASVRIVRQPEAATFDAGYFKVEQEPCVPLKSGPRMPPATVPATASRTADDALLHYRWRQVQQRLPLLGSPQPAVPCYYFAP